MVVIRLARGGAKKRPFYHIVVTNSRNSRDGRFIEKLGFYNPIAAGEEIKLQLNQERLDYWKSKGAQLSERVAHLVNNFAEIVAGTLKKAPTKSKKAKKAEAEAKPEAEEKAPEVEPAKEEKPVVDPELARPEPAEVVEVAEEVKTEAEAKPAEEEKAPEAEKPVEDPEKAEVAE